MFIASKVCHVHQLLILPWASRYLLQVAMLGIRKTIEVIAQQTLEPTCLILKDHKGGSMKPLVKSEANKHNVIARDIMDLVGKIIFIYVNGRVYTIYQPPIDAPRKE